MGNLCFKSSEETQILQPAKRRKSPLTSQPQQISQPPQFEQVFEGRSQRPVPKLASAQSCCPSRVDSASGYGNSHQRSSIHHSEEDNILLIESLRRLSISPSVVNFKYHSGRIARQPLKVQKKRFIKKSCADREFLAKCLGSIGRDISEFDFDITKNYQSELSEYYCEYQNVVRRFGKRHFEVEQIKKVDNPFLLLRYELKKLEYKKTYGHVNEMDLFHATKDRNISKICRRNFDWRLCGKAKGVKFGQGVSFSPSSYYAHHYGDVMILAKVLVSHYCRGNKNTVLPLHGYDTTINHDKKVYVKYEDDSFYPAYVIYYSKKCNDGNSFN